MVEFLTVVLALVAVAAVLAVLVMAARFVDDVQSERSRIDMEVRRAEDRLQELARQSFQVMLEAARQRPPCGPAPVDGSERQLPDRSG